MCIVGFCLFLRLKKKKTAFMAAYIVPNRVHLYLTLLINSITKVTTVKSYFSEPCTNSRFSNLVAILRSVIMMSLLRRHFFAKRSLFCNSSVKLNNKLVRDKIQWNSRPLPESFVLLIGYGPATMTILALVSL